jgi:hypothetical protein
MKPTLRIAAAAAFLALAALLVSPLPAAAGKGNQIPPGQNPFAYLLGLIEDLEAEIAVLQQQIDDLAGGGCAELASVIEGTWEVANVGHGSTGQVTFATDGTYTIDSGEYNAGGSWFPASSGTWEVVAGGSAIGFTYAGWGGAQPFSRLAWVQCAEEDEIVHFVLGHTHDLEVLTRVP